MDYLKIKKETKITNEFDADEAIIFSSKINKINDYGKKQGRSICITNKRVYNLDKKKVKRAIGISYITAMTKNNSEKNIEFVIHVSSESDYRFKCDKVKIRDEIFSIVKENYAQLTKENLPIYGVTEEDLKDYHTVKADAKKQI